MDDLDKAALIRRLLVELGLTTTSLGTRSVPTVAEYPFGQHQRPHHHDRRAGGRPGTGKVRNTVFHKGQLLIDGEWADPAGGERFETVNPATGEVIGELALAGPADVAAAVAAAGRAFASGD